ncbi:MAG: YceD family protein [Gammaproteobacteria bacterium]
MSPSPLPAYLDTRKVFTQQVELNGSLDLARMPRLQQALAGDRAAVQAQFRCSVATDGLRLIEGRVEARVEVACQRCLEPVEIKLEDQISLAVLANEEQAEGLDPALDPWICTDFRLEIAAMVEEQLILCLPVVNYHPDRACLGVTTFGADEAGTATAGSAREHPFAALKALKEKDGKV